MVQKTVLQACLSPTYRLVRIWDTTNNLKTAQSIAWQWDVLLSANQHTIDDKPFTYRSAPQSLGKIIRLQSSLKTALLRWSLLPIELRIDG